MSEAVDGDSAETVPDSCGHSSIIYPTTPSSGLVGLGGAAGDSSDEDLESSSSFLDEHQDLERQGSGLESKKLINDDEISNLNRRQCEPIDLDSHIKNSTNKLNSLKTELATKMKENLSVRWQLDDAPVQTELIQYERRFSELYAQIQEKHHLTRRHYATYNALLEIKELMLKEASLLNSINLQFKDAMTTPSGRYKFLDSMEVIVKGAKHKLEKAERGLLAEQKACESLKEKHTSAVAEQRHFSSLLHTFQDACAEYERLLQLSST
ncbi:coiled-coil domain-containing protein 93 isoform X1 [Dendrobium catenatum]|uniref:coiled-coil domain-containing protein 93 isoform X1 n=1 Tax=Dendrobium catenatum TaxID=906689 RepID=UPI0009F3E771|nr:coiled-coil domain-containing protein 93 isoform X1 [Dendrobium catenatum]